MAPKSHDIPVYEEHIGTIRVSAQTNPPNCAAKAVKCLEQDGVLNIDFLCVGRDASYQATVAMSLFRIFQEENTKGEFSLAFTPFHVYTMAENRTDPTKPKTQLTATVWRTVLLNSEQSRTLLQLNPTVSAPPTPTDTLPVAQSP